MSVTVRSDSIGVRFMLCCGHGHRSGLSIGCQSGRQLSGQGSVSDESGGPIPGIRVIADYSTDVVYRADTLYTDKEGQFSKFLSIPRVDKFFMTFSDIDGVYESRYENVVPVRTEISSGHFGGSFIVSIDVSLKRK